jgi:hypothetical protein
VKLAAIMNAMEKCRKWPEIDGGIYNFLLDEKVLVMCGHCQLVCHPDRDERKRRHQILVESGVVVQNPDGSLEALPPKTAIDRLQSIDSDSRALYEET